MAKRLNFPLDFLLSKKSSEKSCKKSSRLAVSEGKLYTTMSHNKVSYRIKDQENIDTENDDFNQTYERDSEWPKSKDYVNVGNFKRIQAELEEFNRFSHGEILLLKAQTANRPSINPSESDREALLKCLQDRIISLEPQLFDKQKIIEGLLEGPRFEVKTIDGSKSCLDNETRPSPSGIQKMAGKSEARASAIITRSLTKRQKMEENKPKIFMGMARYPKCPDAN